MTKQKNVLIFFSFRKHKTGYYNALFNPLRDVEKDYDLNLEQGSLKDLIVEIIDNSLVVTDSMTGKRLDEFDYVYFQLWLKAQQPALAAATYLERKGIPFIGHEILGILAATKVGELVRLSDNGIPLPRSFMSSYAVTLEKFKSNPPIQYPFIAKASDAFGGNMNYLVHDYTELKAALTAHKEMPFVLQEFVPNEFDYRVLIMNSEIKLLMKRSRHPESGSHLNNTSAGADGEFVPIDSLTPEQRQDALEAARLTLRSDFAGVDLLINSETGQHVILEVNEAPAIQMGAEPEIKIKTLMQHIKEQANK